MCRSSSAWTPRSTPGRRLLPTPGVAVTLQTPLVVDGGSLSASTLINQSRLEVRSGSVGTVQNDGLIVGDGTIAGAVTNSATGTIRVDAGKAIFFTGTLAPNAGELNLARWHARLHQRGSTNAPRTDQRPRHARFRRRTDQRRQDAVLRRADRHLWQRHIHRRHGRRRDDQLRRRERRHVLRQRHAQRRRDSHVAHEHDGVLWQLHWRGSVHRHRRRALRRNLLARQQSRSSRDRWRCRNYRLRLRGLSMELGGTFAGDQHDQLQVGGLLVARRFARSYACSMALHRAMATHSICSTSARSPAVSTRSNLPALDAGLVWDTSALYSTGAITAVPEPAGWIMLLGGIMLTAACPIARRHSTRFA